MDTIYKVEISAETSEQASTILNALLASKLVTGGQIISSPARFLWKGELVDMPYVTVTSFTTAARKAEIIKSVETISDEEVPMIAFIPIETNTKLRHWVMETVA